MPPAKSWTPSSESPDSGEGTRDAPHGYRPWPNSGRDEHASPFRVRRPSLLESFLAKLRSKTAVVAVVGRLSRSIPASAVKNPRDADAIVIGRISRNEAAVLARRLCRGQVVVLADSTGILAPFKKVKRRILLAWKRGRTFDGIDDDSRAAASALYGD